MPATRAKSRETSGGPPVHALAVSSREEFLANFDASFAHGGIFCPTRKKLNEGDRVVIRVGLGRRQPAVLIAGRVAWRRAGRHSQKIRAGLGIAFEAEGPGKTEFLMDLGRVQDERSRRRHERIRVEVPVSWRLSGSASVGGHARGMLSDIGRGGAFVRSGALVPEDSEIVLELEPPGAQVAMAVTARVTRSVKGGPDAGFGVRWRARDAGGSKRIRELVRRLTGPQAGVGP
jgi:Tfp pilus assembly protein PilZ